MTSIEGKRVLVVGASSGVGRAFAIQAIKSGADVVVSARRSDRLNELLTGVAIGDSGAGNAPRAIAGDIRIAEDRQRIVEVAIEHLGAIDLLFYAVGYAPLRHLVEMTDDEWRNVFETNVIGLQQLLASLVTMFAPGGIAAVLSSETAGKARHSLGAYGASKAALTESLRAWQLEHPEMRFSCIALGETQPTEFADAFDHRALGPVVATWLRHGLMQRESMATDDVARLLVDLFASALAFPGIGIEQIVLRSPSAVVGSDGS
ncbi:MAG: SDR family oxidoreductase [Actinomycetes bacterium]